MSLSLRNDAIKGMEITSLKKAIQSLMKAGESRKKETAKEVHILYIWSAREVGDRNKQKEKSDLQMGQFTKGLR